jgi:hypothetical protein
MTNSDKQYSRDFIYAITALCDEREEAYDNDDYQTGQALEKRIDATGFTIGQYTPTPKQKEAEKREVQLFRERNAA